MTFSRAVAAHVASSAAVRGYIDVVTAVTTRSRRRGHSMCDPSTDASIGWILTHLAPLPNITLVDLTYSARVALRLDNVSSDLLNVRRRTAIIHRASNWEAPSGAK